MCHGRRHPIQEIRGGTDRRVRQTDTMTIGETHPRMPAHQSFPSFLSFRISTKTSKLRVLGCRPWKARISPGQHETPLNAPAHTTLGQHGLHTCMHPITVHPAHTSLVQFSRFYRCHIHRGYYLRTAITTLANNSSFLEHQFLSTVSTVKPEAAGLAPCQL